MPHFPTRRGRPRRNTYEKDFGTPELQEKRSQGITAEILDRLLHEDHISPTQHWCGIHLRWLYTLRYGAPSVRAIDPLHFGGTELKTDDPKWRTLREQEFHEAMSLLRSHRLDRLLIDCCIYNARATPLGHIQQGLDLLDHTWR